MCYVTLNTSVVGDVPQSQDGKNIVDLWTWVRGRRRGGNIKMSEATVTILSVCHSRVWNRPIKTV